MYVIGNVVVLVAEGVVAVVHCGWLVVSCSVLFVMMMLLWSLMT